MLLPTTLIAPMVSETVSKFWVARSIAIKGQIMQFKTICFRGVVVGIKMVPSSVGCEAPIKNE